MLVYLDLIHPKVKAIFRVFFDIEYESPPDEGVHKMGVKWGSNGGHKWGSSLYIHQDCT